MDVSYTTVVSIKSYFEGKDPLPGRKLLDVKSLSGGLCNFIYRLYFNDSSTAILKYFGKNVAFNEAAIDQSRYFMEKNSLNSFGSHPYFNMHRSNYPQSIASKLRIPKLFYSDDSAFLLIMEDAGENAQPLGTFLMKGKDDSSGCSTPEMIELLAEGIYEFLTFLSDKSNVTFCEHKVNNLNFYKHNKFISVFNPFWCRNILTIKPCGRLFPSFMTTFLKVSWTSVTWNQS